MSQRTARVDELLREEISSILRRDVDDPRIGFVTITDVEVDRELRHANVWVSVMGSDTERRVSVGALVGAMPFVRRQLGKLRLKRIPALHIKEDHTSERATRILRIIEELESGHEADTLPAAPVVETLPTPGGVSAREAVTAEGEVRGRGTATGGRKASGRGKTPARRRKGAS